MTGKRIGYIRVSTADQNPDRQLDGIQLDKKFVDYASGKDTKRTQLEILLEYVREDDVVFVHSMDRMARNMVDLRQLVDQLTTKGVELHFITENLRFNGKNDAISKLMLSIMGAVAEFELANIRERQAQGIAVAKAKGRYEGRPYKIKGEKLQRLYEEYNSRKPLSQIARDFEISPVTLYRYLKRLGIEHIPSKKFPEKVIK